MGGMNADPVDLCFSGMKTGMARAVMHEIAACLESLAREGKETTIDLRSLPLTAADLLELEALLGEGEVRVDLEVLGATRIWETAYTGVWWLRHFGANKQTASEEIAITSLPEILKSHPEDIDTSAARLRKELEQADTGETEQEASNG
jgi:hydrogenase-1 operon protein HyaF